MKAFLVHYTGVKEVYLSQDNKNKLNQRLNDLLRENILQRSFLSEDQNEMWLYFYAEDLEMVEMISSSLNTLLSENKRIVSLHE